MTVGSIDPEVSTKHGYGGLFAERLSFMDASGSGVAELS
jgi:hypothetical protein